MRDWASFFAVVLFSSCLFADAIPTSHPVLDRVGVSADAHSLVFRGSAKAFVPWGFNYDRDYKMRLIEDYWIGEWATVASDFREMKALGANIVRIHLSVGQFLESPTAANAKNVAQLAKLVHLCESLGIYLDVTGLGCYRKEATPDWFVHATESQRWAMQARFWEVVAEACGDSPAIAWFDLVNEAVVPGDKQADWMAGHLEAFWYCQFITLDPAGRDRGEIARAWVKQMSAAIRKFDRDALITVGMLPFTAEIRKPSMGMDVPGLKDSLDLICVHIYPKRPPYTEALKLVDLFNCGKPLVIEEIFPMECRAADLPGFFAESKKRGVGGWIGFYWGQTEAELGASTKPSDRLILDWLRVFERAGQEMTNPQ